MSKLQIETSYIGDAVYASFDGYHVWLTADENKIALEDAVLRALDEYRTRIDAHYGIKRFAPLADQCNTEEFNAAEIARQNDPAEIKKSTRD